MCFSCCFGTPNPNETLVVTHKEPLVPVVPQRELTKEERAQAILRNAREALEKKGIKLSAKNVQVPNSNNFQIKSKKITLHSSRIN